MGHGCVIYFRKGQSFSLRNATNHGTHIKKGTFCQDTYTVPKADGRIVVSATFEGYSFDPSVFSTFVVIMFPHGP
jgi:hypothetical protein